MASTIRQRLRRFNGTDYDTIHLETETGAISDYPHPSNPNLLDNWYFVGGGSQQGGGQLPINQRGGYLVPPGTPYYRPEEGFPYAGTTDRYYTVTNIDSAGSAFLEVDGITYFVPSSTPIVPGYTGAGYGIDRWQNSVVDEVLAVNSNGIQLTSGLSSGYCGILQKSEYLSQYVGQSVTGSLLVGNQLLTGTITVPSRGNYTNFNLSPTLSMQLVNIDIPYCEILSFAPDSGVIQAVKLELGDHQTLAHQDTNGNWVLNEVPKYGEGLRECQRYFWMPDLPNDTNNTMSLAHYNATNKDLTFTQLNCIAPRFPVTMRISPGIYNVFVTNWRYNGEWVPLSINWHRNSRDGVYYIALNDTNLDRLYDGDNLFVKFYADANL